jgi:hypothetical protein
VASVWSYNWWKNPLGEAAILTSTIGDFDKIHIPEPFVEVVVEKKGELVAEAE